MSINLGFEFDHRKSSIFEACGIDLDEDGFEQKVEDLEELLKALGETSKTIQFLFENIDDTVPRAVLINLLRKTLHF